MQRYWALMIVGVLWFAGIGDAATYWVSKSGNNNNACFDSATQPTLATQSRLTIAAGLTCLSAGDTLIVKAGTYAESLLNQIPGGTSEANRTILSAATGETVTMLGVPGDQVIGMNTSASQYITIQGFILDGSNGNANVVSFVGDGASFAHHVRLKDCELKNAVFNQGISLGPGGASTVHELINVHVHNNGASCYVPGLCHGVYVASNDNLIDGGSTHNNEAYGLQLYQDGGAPSGNTVRNFRSYNNGNVGLGAFWGTGNALYNNVVYNNSGIGIWVSTASSTYHSNTVYNNGQQGLFVKSDAPTGNIARNNIVWSNSGGNIVDETSGGSITLSNNLQADPSFANAPGGDFHLTAASINAINQGFTLGAPYNVDAEGVTRPVGVAYDIGAYEFQSTPPPSVPDLIAHYACEGNMNDSSVNGFHLTANGGMLANGAPIIGINSCNFDGVDDYASRTATASEKPTEQFYLSAWMKTTTPGRWVYSIGDSPTMRLLDDGNVRCFFQHATGYIQAQTTGQNYADGTAHHVVCSYDSRSGQTTSGLRIWVDNAQQAFLASTALVAYPTGNNVTLGRHANLSAGFWNGVIDQVRVGGIACDATCVANYFNEQVPIAGVSSSHCVWSQANAAEGMFLGGANEDRSHVVTVPLGVRCNVKRVGSTIIEHLKWFASRNGGAFVEVTDTLNSAGVRYLADSTVTMGQNTSAHPSVIPAGGFTFVAGKFYEAPVDTGVQVTLADSQYTEMEGRFAFGAPLVAADTLQLRLQRNTGTVFEEYGLSTRTITLTVPAVGRVQLGGVTAGGIRR